MDSHKLWRGRIDQAYALQSKQHKQWKDAVSLYNCDYFDKLLGGFDPERVDVNFANWYISNLIPLVYFRDPYIFVKPRHEKYSGFAETMEIAINYTWRELRLKQQFKKCIQSAFMMPPGWVKLGYTAKIGQDVAKMDEIKQKSIISDIKDAITGIFKNKEEKTPAEQGVLDMHITEESVFASWIPSWNMLMPPGYHEVSKMPWLVEIEDMTMLDFSNNKLYKNKDKTSASRDITEKDSRGQIVNKVPYNEISSNKDEFSIIRLYHIWDRRNQMRLTISDKAVHFEGEWPYDLEGFPYKHLNFDESLPSLDESNSYPPNCLVPIMPQIIEKSMARSMMVKHRKRAAAALLVAKGQLTEEEIDNLSESDVMQIVTVTNPQAITSLVLPSLSPDVYNVEALIDQDLQAGTNMGQMMFQAQKGQRTATQAQIGASGLQLKSSARVDCVEDFTMEVASGLCQLMWQFYDRDKMKEITGEDVTEDMWPTLPDNPTERRRIIQAELNIKIDAGSTSPPKDETVDRKQLLDMVSIVANIAPERLNKGEVVKQVLKKFKFAKDLDKMVKTNDEEEQKQATEETQLMMKGAPQVVGSGDNHEIHIQVHSQAAGQPLVDQHIIQHGQMLGIMPQGGGGQGNPQQGDARPPMSSTNPEQVRKGIANEGDINQSVQNLGVGTGAEAK